MTEVAERYGVSRESVRAWLRRYRDEGPSGLADRSHKIYAHPWQTPAEVESAVCELRRAHPRWGPKRLVFEMDRRGPFWTPSASTACPPKSCPIFNGTVFIGRFIKPRPAEVLFERICRENGITQRLTRPAGHGGSYLVSGHTLTLTGSLSGSEPGSSGYAMAW